MRSIIATAFTIGSLLLAVRNLPQKSANSIAVPVVVRDAQGNTIPGLAKENFHLFDKTKPLEINSFSVEKRTAPSSSIIFVIDDLHASAADLSSLKIASEKIVDATLRSGDSASVLSILGSDDSGMTTDRQLLLDTVSQIRSLDSPYRLGAGACPYLDYYRADRIENQHDERAFDIAVDEATHCAHLDPIAQRLIAERQTHESAQRAVSLGEQGVAFSYAYLREVVRKLANLPGQRNLILISPGFYSDSPEALARQAKLIEAAARANITISVLDFKALGRAAAEGAKDSSDANSGIPSPVHSNVESVADFDSVLSNLVDATGGVFIHTSADLANSVRRLSSAPEVVYLLEFSLDSVQPDDRYHPLHVNVDRNGANIQSRRGYFAPASANLSALMREPPAPASLDKSSVESAPITKIAAPDETPVVKLPKPKGLSWTPPNIDARIHASSGAPTCSLDAVLAKASERATELIENLQNFTAREEIEYRNYGLSGLSDFAEGDASFDYTAVLATQNGAVSFQESRQPTQPNRRLPQESQDVGLPEMALIFLPEIQSDYDMKCEGAADRNGRSAWVISFRPRQDRPNQTAVFNTPQGPVAAPMRGRASIDQNTGVVIHMDLALLHEIPAVNIREWSLSIDYAPVRFRSKNVVVWLPQSAYTYAALSDIHRTVSSHTFSNFFLFSVQTTQEDAHPAQ